jgi:hypothetical protein
VDSDQYGCLATGNHLDPGAIALGRSINAHWNTDLDYGIAGIFMAATMALITGVGMIRLLQFPIKIGDQPTVDSPAPAKSISLRS